VDAKLAASILRRTKLARVRRCVTLQSQGEETQQGC